MDKVREAFDQSYLSKFPNSKAQLLPNGNYSGFIKQQAWKAWQSRQAEVDELKSRIEGLESWIEGQIENLKCASESWVYTEREKNIMLSQADDLKKALRGERE